MGAADERHTVSIALVVVEHTAPAVLYSMLELFSSVGTVWEMLTDEPSGSVRMRAEIVASGEQHLRGTFRTPVVMPDRGFDDTSTFDVVIAPDMLLEADTDPHGQWPTAAAWIREQFEHGAIVASVCTGAILLAEAGLLDDREATSHWSVVPLFRQCYPAVRLQPEKVLALSGPEQRIITAGGAASWSELALYLVARFCGQLEAIRLSKVFLLGDRSEGQLPFAAMARPRGHSDAVIDQCQVWIAEHYELANPVQRMVEHSGLTPRTFKRRFQSATGYTPIEYVQTLRVEEAKHLLETTEMASDYIGGAVGYTDPAAFRRLFKRMTGVTPARYRQRVKTIAALPGTKTERHAARRR
ncbi:MAG: helix-turn-helix domain-containing protein [Gammaproteobacteria bacterium]|nr:helix-turn-helix domain-containing protein [Gammaproteobacteria bacterium]